MPHISVITRECCS